MRSFIIVLLALSLLVSLVQLRASHVVAQQQLSSSSEDALSDALTAALTEALAESSTSASTSTSVELDSAALWARYRDILFGFLERKTSSKSRDGLQLLPEAVEATWGEGWDRSGLAAFANQVSSWGAVWDPQPTLLPDQYNRFLNNIKVPFDGSVPASVARAFEDSQMQMDMATQGLMQARMTCMMFYFQDPNAAQMFGPYSSTFEDFMCPEVKPAMDKLKRAQAGFDVAASKQAGQYRDVLTAVNNFIGDYSNKAWVEWNSLSSFVNRARSVPQGQHELSLAFNSRTAVREKRTFIAKRTRGFLMFRRTRTTNKEELRFRNEFFDMQIRAQGFAAINVAPGQWYDAEVVSRYRSSSMWRDPTKSFFGPSGTMGLVMKTIFVVYKPQVTIRLNKEEGNAFRSAESSSFSFGPFSSQKQSVVQVRDVDQHTTEVVFMSNVESPQIIAVDYHTLHA